MSKPRVLVTRAVFPETIDKLKQHFDVEANTDDAEWSRFSDEKIVVGIRYPRGYVLHCLIGAPLGQECLVVAVVFGTNFADGADQGLAGGSGIRAGRRADDRCL
jgi:hypothetical protein